MSINPESSAPLAADPSVTDPLTADDGIAAQYGDVSYEYDDRGRIVRTIGRCESQTYSYGDPECDFADG